MPATLDTRLRPGEGFWIIQQDEDTVDLRLPVGSNRLPRDTLSLACDAPSGCWRVALSGDLRRTPWILVGNPFDRALAVGDTVATTPTGLCASPAGCTFTQASDAASANLIGVPLFRWDDTASTPFYEALDGGGSLPPWSGIWVRETDGAAGNAPSLDLPYRD